MRPMLATPATVVPAGDGWVHEVKWDGMRIVAHAVDGRVRLSTRDGRDATARFPELADLGAGLDEVVLDGEVVDLADGLPSFHRLITRIHATPALAQRLARSAPVTYMAFDVVRLGGRDLYDVPLSARRELLEAIGAPGTRARLSPTYTDGASLRDATREQGLEGTVSKRLDSGYEPGRRSPDWLKLAHRPTRSVVVGGWRPETGGGRRVGALLVGVPAAGGSLAFVGRVGSGLSDAAERDLRARLSDLGADADPFDPAVPGVDARGARWVRPEVVVDVRSLGGISDPGADGAPAGAGPRLRQPVYVGLRADLAPDDLRADARPAGPAESEDLGESGALAESGDA